MTAQRGPNTSKSRKGNINHQNRHIMEQYIKPTFQVIEFEISNIIASSGSSSSSGGGYSSPTTNRRSDYSKSDSGYSKGGGYKKK